MPKRNLSSTSVVPSSGNVFEDLGLPDAEEKQTKVRLAVGRLHSNNQDASPYMIAIRAEKRLALMCYGPMCYRPGAFIQGIIHSNSATYSLWGL
jgi:hypothetical protein